MKIIYNTLLAFFLILLLNNCEKDKSEDIGLSKTLPQSPQMTYYDLNDDLVNDFKLEYQIYTWDGINSSGDGISADFQALNQSLILRKADHFSLFLAPGDTIKNVIEPPFYWDEYMASLVSISTLTDAYVWASEWKIHCDQDQDFYYLGIKLRKDNSYSLGWMKLQIDTSNGVVVFVEEKFSNDDYILVGK